jgi:hypothetical protein
MPKTADERIRTADLTSLRVRGLRSLSVAEICISRIGEGLSFPTLPTIAGCSSGLGPT